MPPFSLRNGFISSFFARFGRRFGCFGGQKALDTLLNGPVCVEGGLQKFLSGVVRRDDQLAEKIERQNRSAILRLIDDDLGLDYPSDILTGFRVQHLNVVAFADQGGDFLEVHVPAGAGVVEAPVRIFPDNSGRHSLPS